MGVDVYRIAGDSSRAITRRLHYGPGVFDFSSAQLKDRACSGLLKNLHCETGITLEIIHTSTGIIECANLITRDYNIGRGIEDQVSNANLIDDAEVGNVGGAKGLVIVPCKSQRTFVD